MYEREESKSDMKLVVFRLADEEFGASINQVHEIIKLVEITRIPRAPKFIEGVINLRGRIVPIVDLRKRFGFPISEDLEEQRIMEVDVEGQVLGMVVDEVTEVISITADTIEPAPPMIADIAGEYMSGIAKVNDRILIMLNFDKILSEQENKQLEEKNNFDISQVDMQSKTNQKEEAK